MFLKMCYCFHDFTETCQPQLRFHYLYSATEIYSVIVYVKKIYPVVFTLIHSS